MSAPGFVNVVGAILPEGFALPGLVYLVPLVLTLLATVGVLVFLDPEVTDWTVVAFAPWMMLGAVLHVLYRQDVLYGQDVYPDIIQPLFGTPTVYLTTATLAAAVWSFSTLLAAMRRTGSNDRQLGIVGGGFTVVFVTFAMVIGANAGGLTATSAFWPVIGLVVAGVTAAVAWLVLSLTFTDAAAVTGAPGALVVFAHSLDAISTAIGVDVLGAGERTPLSAAILEFSAGLPTAEFIGSGWLFVLVKLLLALVIVAALEDLYRDAPRQARTLLGGVAAVGLGPGIHNLLLFAVTGG
jgi:uncharacterized membrane protein